jgi:betaine reductase
LEKAGIPTVQITAALPVAKMVGANRLVLGNGIVHVVGDAKVSKEDEKKLRRGLVEQALAAMQK